MHNILGSIVLFGMWFWLSPLCFSQQHIVDSLEQFVRPVTDDRQFDELVRFFNEVYEISKSNKIVLSDNYLSYCESAMNWAVANGSERDILLAKGLYLHFYNNQIDDAQIIARGNDIRSEKELYTTVEMQSVLKIILRAFWRTEHYLDYLQVLENISRWSKNSDGTKPFFHRDEFHTLALLHYNLGNYRAAVNAYHRHLAVSEEKNIHNRASKYNDLGWFYQKLNLKDSAELVYTHALSLIESEIQDNEMPPKRLAGHLKNVIRANRASLDLDERKYNEIKPYFEAELNSALTFHDLNSMVSSQYRLAELDFRMGDWNSCQVRLDSVFSWLKLFKNDDLLKKSWFLRALSYSALGEEQKANEAFDDYYHIIDSLERQQASKQYLKTVIEFETSKKEREIAENKHQIAVEKTRIKYQNILLVILLLLSVGLFIVMRKAGKSAGIIQQQKREVDKSLREKEILLKEVHHRVKNNLQIVSGLLVLQSGKIKSSEMEALVRDTQRHVDAMALVHQLLYQNDEFEEIDMQDYMGQLGSQILNSLGNHSQLTVNCQHIQLSIEKAIPLGLIVSELITNSTKHAFPGGPGHIKIELYQSADNLYRFTYSDDGVGMTMPKEEIGVERLGVRLIHMLAEEIDAVITMENVNGLTYHFEFEES